MKIENLESVVIHCLHSFYFVLSRKQLGRYSAKACSRFLTELPGVGAKKP